VAARTMRCHMPVSRATSPKPCPGADALQLNVPKAFLFYFLP
jgi:hypothetical protein